MFSTKSKIGQAYMDIAYSPITCQYSPESKSNGLPDWSVGCDIHTSSPCEETVMVTRYVFFIHVGFSIMHAHG